MENYKIKYENLVEKVNQLLYAQQSSQQNPSNVNLLVIARKREKEVREITIPKPKQVKQSSLWEYLAR